MNSNHLKITAIILAAFLIIITDLALLGLFDNSKYYESYYIFDPYYVLEMKPGDYLQGDEVPFVIDYDSSYDKWQFRDADEWNAIRKNDFAGYLLSDKMPNCVKLKDLDWSQVDTANKTKIPELNHTFYFRADDGILRYKMYFRNAMNVECIEALSNITYTLSRQTVTDNLTREELKDIPEELIYSKDKSIRISNLQDHESTTVEDAYSLPTPKINEIYYLRVSYKGIDSVDVPGRTIPKPDFYDPIRTSVFVIKDNRTRFDSPYNEFTANILETQKKRNTINDTAATT